MCEKSLSPQLSQFRDLSLFVPVGMFKSQESSRYPPFAPSRLSVRRERRPRGVSPLGTMMRETDIRWDNFGNPRGAELT